MLIDVGFGVAGRKMVHCSPTSKAGHHAAVFHGEPVVAPEIDIDRGSSRDSCEFLGYNIKSAFAPACAM